MSMDYNLLGGEEEVLHSLQSTSIAIFSHSVITGLVKSLFNG